MTGPPIPGFRPLWRGCDLWRIDLAGEPVLLDAWRNHVLIAAEREAGDRYATPGLRSRFVSAHGALRQILGLYVEPASLALPFILGPAGKPRLAGSSRGICFSISHSADQALVAVSHLEVGVDLEQRRLFADMEQVAGRIAGPGEMDRLRAETGRVDPARFFRLWTCKEAVCKATGEGLGADPRRIDVAMAIGCAAGETLEGREPYAGISLRPLEGPPGYAAALASLGSLEQVRTYRADFRLTNPGGPPSLVPLERALQFDA